MENTVTFKEINEQVHSIEKCLNYNSRTLDDLTKIINNFKPNNVIIAARGTSMHSGVYAKYLFEVYYGIPASLVNPSVYTVYNADVDLSKTLVIAISQSGKAKDVLEVIKHANKKGALTLGITNTLDSIVAKEASHHLYCNVGEAVSYTATKTFTTTMYLITKLIYGITNNPNLNIDEAKLIDSLNNGLSYKDNINKLVEDFRNFDDTIVLARGIPLALAMEMALKIKETSHFHVSSYPLSEFYHGPIAMLNKSMPMIIIAVDKKTNDDVKQLLKDTSDTNSYKLIITNDTTINYNNKIFIDEEDDLYALFTTIIILQLFSCGLSVLRGNNPDYLKILELPKPI